MMLEVVLLLILASKASAQTVAISPSSLTGTEGSNLTVDCSVVGGGRTDFELTVDDIRIVTLAKFVGASVTPTGTQFVYGPLERSDSDKVFECDDSGGNRASATLVVHYPPAYSLLPNKPTTVLEGEDFTYSFGFEANSTPINFTWSRDGQVISSGGRIAFNVSTISITSATRSDSGVYEVVSYNEAGRGAGNFTLDVQFPPLIINRASQTALAQGKDFTFDCTSEPANPAAVGYTFQKDGQPVNSSRATVQGPVLTVTSVQTGDGGNYSCSASNSVGKDTVYNSLIVPPGVPQALAVSDVGPFQATVSWQPPMEDGGAVGSLMYNVMLTNTSDSTTFTFNPTAALTINLANLRHSVTYRVQVVAGNEAGMGPAAEVMFRTNDTVPIIDSVSAMALSLSAFRVNITLLTDGGQSVTLYTVEIRGVSYTGIVEGSDQSWVSVLVNQLDQNFTKGETHTVRVFATNSVGTSNPRSTLLIVPAPPMTTASPAELSTTNIPVCCAGVQLNLANPDDPIDVRVLVDGTLHPPNQVTRNGSFLYIMGLQAGTEYSLRIALSNIFGIEWINTTVRPLLGRPSTPQVALTPTAGGLTVQLTVMYPGTREDTLQYSISTSPSPLSRRQTGQQPLPVTDLTTPTSGSAEVALGAGTYSVTVTVTNKHGSTMSASETVTIPEPSTSVDIAVVIGVVVAVVIVILLIILAVFIVVLIFMKRRDTKAMSKPKNEGSGDADYKEMVDTNSTDPLAPHYEDPSTLERQAPPPVVTYKKEEEAAAVQPAPAPSGLVYADLDFSRQQAFGSKKPEKKKPDPIETVVYSEVRLMTPQETQQGEGDVGGDGAEPHSSTSIM